MTIIPFVTANYVARAAGFHLEHGWKEGDQTTREAFRPIETFEERFDDMLADIQGIGFNAVDIWDAHLGPSWATDRHIEIARNLLARRGMTVTSLAGGFGTTLEQFEASCRLVRSLGADILAGSTVVLADDRPGTIDLLERHDVRLAIENHPQVPTPEAMGALIGNGAGGHIGTAVDTGWYATVGRDPAQAILALGPHILNVHLKDIKAAGAHDTCRFGDGIVPIEACVQALQEARYTGPISVEHEPEDHDPTEECKESLEMLRHWVAS